MFLARSKSPCLNISSSNLSAHLWCSTGCAAKWLTSAHLRATCIVINSTSNAARGPRVLHSLLTSAQSTATCVQTPEISVKDCSQLQQQIGCQGLVSAHSHATYSTGSRPVLLLGREGQVQVPLGLSSPQLEGAISGPTLRCRAPCKGVRCSSCWIQHRQGLLHGGYLLAEPAEAVAAGLCTGTPCCTAGSLIAKPLKFKNQAVWHKRAQQMSPPPHPWCQVKGVN